jgi:hypothetical protein
MQRRMAKMLEETLTKNMALQKGGFHDQVGDSGWTAGRLDSGTVGQRDGWTAGSHPLTGLNFNYS